MILFFFIIMLSIVLLIVYFIMCSGVSYLLWISYLSLYSPDLITCKIGGITYVSMVLRYVMSANVLYMPRRVVDCRGDNLIEFFVVLSLHIENNRI